DHIEGRIGERQVGGLAANEPQPRPLAVTVAEPYRLSGEVDTGHRSWSVVAAQVRGTAATPRADLQHVQAGQIGVAEDASIQLDVESARLVARVERDPRRPGRRISVVHERPVAALHPTGQ